MLKHTKWISGFLASSALAVFGACGDGPICPSELVVVIQNPNITDLNATEAGTQVDVTVRSNFHAGDPFVLTITDENNAVSQFNSSADASGNVVFSNITLPGGTVTLKAEGDSDCGTGSDTTDLQIDTDADCLLTIVEGPIENDFFAPIPVLNASNDSDLALPNFQANIQIQTSPGFTVETFVLDTVSGNEASLGMISADASGVAAFPTTLAQGPQAVRATCRSGSVNEASATNTVHVDTVVPECSLTVPADGVTVTPDDDVQGDITDGIQMEWNGLVADSGEGDVEGESVAFFRDALEFAGTSVNAAGETTTDGLAEFTSPGSFAVSVVTQDHAGNACTAGHDVEVILDGCAIAITSPSAIVTTDSNGNDADGVQTDVIVDVAAECVGQTVFVDCGSGEFSAVVAAGPTTVANVTLNANPDSQGTTTCTARVTNAESFETSDARPVEWDTLSPGSVITITSPPGLDCGESVVLSVGNDFDGDLSNGFQIEVQPLGTDEDTLNLQIVNSSGTTDLTDVGEDPLPVTLVLGSNTIQTFAVDSVGNIGESLLCSITVTDIVLTVDDPAGSGVLSSADGSINGSGDLELTVCGTVSLTNTVDVTLTLGADAFTTTVTGNSWCTDSVVAFAEGTHVISLAAASTIDARVGDLSVPVSVDLTAPDSPTTLNVVSPNRREIDADWAASPGATSYVLRFSTTAFTDFENEGILVPTVGTAISATISDLFAGQEYFVGVASVDSSGNVSAPIFAASVTPELDETPIIGPESSGDGVTKQFGAQIVGGDFDNDGFSDIAVSAPFQPTATGAGVVYIYFGSASGISTTAGIVIESTDAAGNFGDGMTKIRWNTNGIDDLAISSWGVNRVYIYDNASLAAAKASGLAPSPDLTITPSSSVGSWFNTGFPGFGTSLAAGQLDAAGTAEDLIIGIPFGGIGFFGGAVIVYGGVPTANTVVVSDLLGDVAGMSGLTGHYFENPGTATFSAMGTFVHYLGDTRADDGVGDFSVSALDENHLYILRGRTAPVAGLPVQELVFGGNDLEVVLPGTASNAFGESLGSIDSAGGTGLRNIAISSALEGGNGALYIVDGGLTGTLTLNGPADYLTRIAGVAGNARFGGAVANNALAGGDVDGDGVEDLVIAGGRADDLGVSVWYGASIPVGDSTADTSDYFVPRPDLEFSNSFDIGSKLPIQITWVGDVNNDGLFDICWGDAKFFHQADGTAGNVDTDDEGRVVVLTDGL